ncbi:MULTISPECIES: molybdopterin molybdotransferase MoeA [Luteococcus]|nr:MULTISPECIES: gephyrin-like molybdotransferase Glp [Luteococcus]MDN5564565.1 molybdopterin molybdotransferase MoeA [Luteococcus sp.]
MGTVDEHREKVRGLVTPLPVASEALLGCHGLCLDQDVTATVPVPAFDCSAMDGFAVRRTDLAEMPCTLPVDGEVPAGAAPLSPAPGHAVRIMTGARLPDGCDVVIPVEHTDARPGAGPVPPQVTITRFDGRGHIRTAGEDVRIGDTVLKAGTRLSATHLAAAAATGLVRLPVRRRPLVAVVTTGDELSAPGVQLGSAQIPDSNSVLVAGLLQELGAEVSGVHHAGDETASLDAQLAALSPTPDLVVTTGGVSVGSHDVVQAWAATSPSAHVELGHVAMQPGRPQGWGHVDIAGKRVPIICLPGNPVAVHVGLHLFVRAALDELAGAPDSRRFLCCVAGTEFPARAGITRMVDVVLDGTIALPAPGGHGSHRIGTLHQCDGLAIITAPVARGDQIQVLLTR